ncbi:histidine kinase [Croceicoccus estronivorus]|uniref:response regulator transcription factor n=1 Tax=Croceicoccus estronivorus TaxID=1172626 RepID=UPI00082A618E|nr:response regulator [Croceicoccus estronivorus]OCC23349.1 histidine kinase [Croceicoccus estronivorus]
MALILLADDDDILVDLVRHRLESDGHSFLVANDGETAVRLAQSEKPDLIILDAMMPILSGVEALRLLRENGATQDLPIMMLTSRKGESDVVNALNLGANEYITKPFRPQELAARVEALLRQYRASRAAR